MKNIYLVALLFISATVFGQNYVSRKQHINTINGDYMLNQVNTFFTIDGDKIINTNKKGSKVYDTFVMGEITKGDKVTRWSFNSASDGTTGKDELVRRSKDTFTNKTSKIVYELTPKD